MKNYRIAWFVLPAILACSASCDLIEDDGSFEAVVPGKIYNSNDGSCATAGESIDFFFDSQLEATVAPGDAVDNLQSLGDHTVQAFIAGTNTRIVEFELHINGPGWWAWAGCQDGTHP